LGFLKPSQANAWIEAEMPHHPTGAIVDILIVFKSIHHSMSNVSTLSLMQQLVKIKVQSIMDGSTITSYDQRIPKFFSKSSNHKVIKDAALFLDLVPLWNDWDNAQTGFCLCLEEELIVFEQAHSEEIDSLQEYSMKAYTVAKLALSASVSWSHGFISFIDTYYHELNKAKFGSAQAWHVTTRLAKRMLDDIRVSTTKGAQILHSWRPYSSVPEGCAGRPEGTQCYGQLQEARLQASSSHRFRTGQVPGGKHKF
jgi:hypothetical protein